MKIGFIGFGRLGSHLCNFLSQDFDILVYDKIDCKSQIEDAGAKQASLDEVCQCQIIIPFVPISAFEGVIKEIAPKLKAGQIIADVCSVKEIPVKHMLKYLPKGVQILGTHPMFGPDSTKKTLFGSKIVLCNVRMKDENYQNILNYLDKYGLKIIETTPKNHDRQISLSLVLPHLIGRTLINFEAEKQIDIDTLGYRRLMKILGVVENDTWQLFQDMNSYNDFSKEVRDGFLHSLKEVIARIEE